MVNKQAVMPSTPVARELERIVDQPVSSGEIPNHRKCHPIFNQCETASVRHRISVLCKWVIVPCSLQHLSG